MGEIVSFLAGNRGTGNFEFLYAFETLLDVFVHLGWVTTVSKKFEEIVVGEEVETRELASFSFEE
jgi:hypothetical protein